MHIAELVRDEPASTHVLVHPAGSRARAHVVRVSAAKDVHPFPGEDTLLIVS